MEAVNFSEILAATYNITWRHDPEDDKMNTPAPENSKHSGYFDFWEHKIKFCFERLWEKNHFR
jgi:hypothetical protein